eukprot:573615-Pelagomonas_calceolata.AAC.5
MDVDAVDAAPEYLLVQVGKYVNVGQQRPAKMHWPILSQLDPAVGDAAAKMHTLHSTTALACPEAVAHTCTTRPCSGRCSGLDAHPTLYHCHLLCKVELQILFERQCVDHATNQGRPGNMHCRSLGQSAVALRTLCPPQTHSCDATHCPP